MPKSQLKRTMEGAFILTIASFIAKVLSAVYRVPFQNLVGDEGFYVYQQSLSNLWISYDIGFIWVAAIYFARDRRTT